MSEMLPDPPEVTFTAWLENLRVDLAETVGGVLVRGARPVAVGVTVGGTKYVTTSPGAMIGYALTNESEADDVTVRVLFHDGNGSDADVIMKVSLAPGESARDWFGPGGISLQAGLYVDYDGPISGSVFMRGAE
jgi:hypothetical protein